ncbi:nucleotidyltransferase domain-containing protein [Thiolapillus sp.]
MSSDPVHLATAEILRSLWRGEIPSWSREEGFTEETFLHDLETQGMSALVWYRLNQLADAPQWPEPVLLSLGNTARREVGVEMLWDSETNRVLAAMTEENIQPLLFKGAAFSHCLYPQAGLRPRCDADLLVPQSDREAAESVMQSLGYEPLYQARAEYISGQMTWVKPDGGGVGYSHDLHWRIRNNHRAFVRAFDYACLSRRSCGVPGLGEHARTLNPADALLLACVHRAGHYSYNGERLIWLHDIHLLVEALGESELELFCAAARDLELEQLCGDAFEGSCFWFGTRLPRELQRMRENAVSHSEGRPPMVVDRAAGIRSTVWRELRGMTWNEGIKYLAQNAFPPPGYMKWRYGRDNGLILPWLYLKRLFQGMTILIRK